MPVAFIDSLRYRQAFLLYDAGLEPGVKIILREHALIPEKDLKGREFRIVEVLEDGEILGLVNQFTLSERLHHVQVVENGTQPIVEGKVVVTDQSVVKRHGVRRRGQEGVQGNVVVIAKQFDLVEGQHGFAPDPSIGAVAGYSQDFGQVVGK